MNDQEARVLAGIVQAAFPRHPWPGSTVALFIDELSLLEGFESAYVATRSFLRRRTGDFPPSPGELVRGISEVLVGAPDFDVAWSEVLAAAADADYFQTSAPAFSHPTVDELVKRIGWEIIRNSLRGDTYFRHAAERAYASIVDRTVQRSIEMPALEPSKIAANIRELVDGMLGEPS